MVLVQLPEDVVEVVPSAADWELFGAGTVNTIAERLEETERMIKFRKSILSSVSNAKEQEKIVAGVFRGVPVEFVCEALRLYDLWTEPVKPEEEPYYEECGNMWTHLQSELIA